MVKKHRWLSLGAACLAALTIVSTAWAAEPKFNPPKLYYLALGDSLAFGYQQQKFLTEVGLHQYDPATFNTGYVDDFATQLATLWPGIKTVNLGCPGETTSSFITSGCAFLQAGFALHTNYPTKTTPQLDAALAFLRANPGKVSPITLSLGANDALQVLAQCGPPEPPGTCAAALPALSKQLHDNLGQILAEFRQASPSSEIIILLFYDPYVAQIPETVGFMQALNAVITNVATAERVRVADVSNLANRENVCTTTLMCTEPPLGGDVHPSDVGYQDMATVVWNASGYERLVRSP